MRATDSVQARHAVAASAVAVERACIEGWVHSTETFGTADGPGIRYVLFMSGCPLRCQYCHNPDTWHRHDGTLTTVEEVLADIARYRGFIRANGGVTLSGGEPLVQPRFCKAVLHGCKSMGLHTALDTSGYLGHLADDELLADVDLVLLDIKAATGRRCRSLTGAELKPTIQFAEDLAAINKAVWLRYVLVPGLTDRLDEIASLATFAAGLGNVERVDVLPFHKLGEHKWRDLGQDYRLERVQPPSPELLEQARETFRAAGLLAH
ncbi:MAG: pyruvate formate lyase-activating protein [Rhodocyclaceae bacterium]|nr:pyruvate formate lyase-activating protein [Rhodocyclaceae bacterium]MCP5239618.1 pyruvate formate lyase-activating protein [Zoogloeaceae bacterium]MCB1911993.1 pyruvate formate lyase-activating protein [Rhodocyclaceae bacterium]MCP5255956.1 pyruvate formate lyase-activating protein [Zoogloeaceae bacterium]MCP5294056.1 pyruvate formate lyase-activating protein [Zoogloeaceae bacterium]